MNDIFVFGVNKTDVKKTNHKRNRYMIFIISAIILLQISIIIYSFVVKKHGQHCDEAWSYGLANSHHKPHFFYVDQTFTEDHKNEWITGDMLNDYITVGEDERFDYGNVIYNMNQEPHPPLYFLMLHTVCSFFPGQYSRWFSFWIGIPVFILLQVFMFLFVRKLFRSDLAGLCAVAFYGFSVAGVSTFVFARQYSLLTMCGVMLAYFHLCLLESESRKERIRTLALLCLVTAIGSLTHYYFLVFSFAFAAVFCMVFLIKKQFSVFAAYASAMIVGVLVSLPFTHTAEVVETQSVAISNVSSGTSLPPFIATVTNAVSSVINILFIPNFEEHISVLINTTLYDLFGIRTMVTWPYIPILLFVLLIVFYCLAVLMALVVRGLVKAKALTEEKNAGLIRLAGKILSPIGRVSSRKLTVIAFLTAVFFEWYIVIGFSSVLSISEYANRYIFITYPFLVIISFMILRGLARLILKIVNKHRADSDEKVKKDTPAYAAAAVMVAVLIISNIIADSIYLYPRPDYEPKLEQMAAETGDKIILIPSAHWKITSYTTLLNNAGDIFLTNSDDYKDNAEKMREAAGDDEIMVIMSIYGYELLLDTKHGFDNDNIRRSEIIRNYPREEIETYYMDFFEDTFPEYDIQFVYEDRIMNEDTFVYKLIKK